MSLILLPKHVKIVEVGPRDGLQNEAGPMLSASVKANLVNQLSAAGLRHIEAAAFVHPKWVPQMANSNEVLAKVKRLSHVSYSALTPNLRGLERALKAGVNEVAVFAAATESFSQRNTNCSIAEGLARFEPLVKMALEAVLKCAAMCLLLLTAPMKVPLSPMSWLRSLINCNRWAATKFLWGTPLAPLRLRACYIC